MLDKPLCDFSLASDVDVRRLDEGVDDSLPSFDGCSECVRESEYRRTCSTLLNDGVEDVVVVDVINRLLAGML